MVDQDLLEILACPKCKGEVKLNNEQNGLFCSACRLLYEIRNDIPIMLVDEAKKVD
ncbi:MAG: Trm112 family protein [Proteobacteria bacterium]|nr:Trm112 family protein [Pseudomonadota bacterium]MBU1715986.1 Trm112 family protein [Pseudomonadota bacterium]